GFARLTQRQGHGHRTIAYLGKGQVFGLTEMAQTASGEAEATWDCSLRAVGYVDVLRIPIDVVKQAILPHCKSQSVDSQQPPENSSDKSEIRNPKSAIDPSLLDF